MISSIRNVGAGQSVCQNYLLTASEKSIAADAVTCVAIMVVLLLMTSPLSSLMACDQTRQLCTSSLYTYWWNLVKANATARSSFSMWFQYLTELSMHMPLVCPLATVVLPGLIWKHHRYEHWFWNIVKGENWGHWQDILDLHKSLLLTGLPFKHIILLKQLPYWPGDYGHIWNKLS